MFETGSHFSANLPKTSVSVAQAGNGVDLFEITAPASVAVILHELRISQVTEAGDAEAEQLHFALKRGVAADAGSGGSSVTPVPVVSSNKSTSASTASSTVKKLNMTQAADAGSGAFKTILEDGAPVSIGWKLEPPPDRLFTIRPGEILVVSLEAQTIADDISFCGYVIFQEVKSNSYIEGVTAAS